MHEMSHVTQTRCRTLRPLEYSQAAAPWSPRKYSSDPSEHPIVGIVVEAVLVTAVAAAAVVTAATAIHAFPRTAAITTATVTATATTTSAATSPTITHVWEAASAPQN